MMRDRTLTGEDRQRAVQLRLSAWVTSWTSRVIAAARAGAAATEPAEASDDDLARQLSGRAGGNAADEALGRLHPDTIHTKE